jgi:hypothetical protein
MPEPASFHHRWRLLLLLASMIVVVGTAFLAIGSILGVAPHARRSPRAQLATGELIDGLRVEGSPEFLAETRRALGVLRATRGFAAVRPYLAVIREGPHSGMWADAPEPTYEVGAPTWKRSTTWYAGSIIHDGTHSLLYHQARGRGSGRRVPDDAWQGAAAEKQCLQRQREALVELKADPSFIRYVEGLMANPTYQNVEYGQRNW